ncbi:hypothetical protein EDB86DRAFT_2983363 [Lactarius hatsudake]|nr:hypothetical protein EDB86DRAFT_2983363 [Lactarius hatsudake]
MVACLAVLPRLEKFVIEFQWGTPRPGQISPPPVVTRTVLPALIPFVFRGASEYLEDLVVRIDSPQLDQIRITYFDQFVDLQVAQLSEFINRSVGHNARVTLLINHASFAMKIHRISYPLYVLINVSCQGIDRQVSHMALVLSHDCVTFSNVVHLELAVFGGHLEQLDGTDDAAWPHLFFHQFSNVQTLHVSQELAGHITLALEDITGEMAAEVFPSLGLIYLAGQPASSIRNFIAARQLSNRPITAIDTEMEFDERLKSYVSE